MTVCRERPSPELLYFVGCAQREPFSVDQCHEDFAGVGIGSLKPPDFQCIDPCVRPPFTARFGLRRKLLPFFLSGLLLHFECVLLGKITASHCKQHELLPVDIFLAGKVGAGGKILDALICRRFLLKLRAGLPSALRQWRRFAPLSFLQHHPDGSAGGSSFRRSCELPSLLSPALISERHASSAYRHQSPPATGGVNGR